MKKQKEESQVRPGGAMPPGPAPPMQGVTGAQPQLPAGHPQSQQMPPQQPQQIAPPPQQVPQQPVQPAGTPVPPVGGPTPPTRGAQGGRKIRVKCPYCNKEFEITA